MEDLMIWQLWWVWLAGALGLAILEVMAPGFIFLGFAVGAAAVAVLLLLTVGFSLFWLLVIFAAVSLLAWIVLRKLFRNPDDQTRIFHEDINK